MKPRPFDVLAILVSLLVAGGLAASAWSHQGQVREVQIEAAGATWIYPLDADRLEQVRGPLGVTVVEIRGGRARVDDSPCPDKLCVGMPAISEPGQWIACLPNRVFIRIKGENGPEVDRLSY